MHKEEEAMTETELQELRDWSAKLMGWELVKPEHGFEYYVEQSMSGWYIVKLNWLPDEVGTGLIWLVMDKLRELQYEVIIHCCYHWKTQQPIYEATIEYSEKHPKYPRGRCRESGDEMVMIVEHPNPCHAILLAGYEALKGGK